MRIVFEDIPEGVSALELSCRAEEIGLEVEDVVFIGPVISRLKLFKQIDKVFVKAELSVDLELECARCLNPVRWSLEATSENQYRPLPKMERDRIDYIGIGYYSGEFIDFSDDFRESLFLELPVKVLCLEDCRGLCPLCGQNLNERECNCQLESEEVRNPKFAELIKMLEVDRKLEV